MEIVLGWANALPGPLVQMWNSTICIQDVMTLFSGQCSWFFWLTHPLEIAIVLPTNCWTVESLCGDNGSENIVKKINMRPF